MQVLSMKDPAYDWAVETSIYVDQSLKHRGIGRMLHDALETALREQGILNMMPALPILQRKMNILTKTVWNFTLIWDIVL